MASLPRFAALPLVAAAAVSAAVVLGTGTAAATVGCGGVYSYSGTRITVQCATDVPGTQFRAIAFCLHGDRYGPWVPQGGGHVSVATCATAMRGWGTDNNG